MWVVTHLYAGLALALLPLPLWALVLVMLASHLLLDLVPHWDYTRAQQAIRWGAADFGVSVLTVALGLSVFGLSLQTVLLGILAAAPDFDVLLHGSDKRYLWPSHRPPFPHGSCGPLPGIAVQAAVIAASIAVLALV